MKEQAIVDERRKFYSALFVARSIAPTKENPTISELKIRFEVHSRYACLKDKSTFEAVVCMCDDFEQVGYNTVEYQSRGALHQFQSHCFVH